MLFNTNIQVSWYESEMGQLGSGKSLTPEIGKNHLVHCWRERAFSVFSWFCLPSVAFWEFEVPPLCFCGPAAAHSNSQFITGFFKTCLNIINMHWIVMSNWETVDVWCLPGMREWDGMLQAVEKWKSNGKSFFHLQWVGQMAIFAFALLLDEGGNISCLSRNVGHLCSCLWGCKCWRLATARERWPC